MTMADTADWDQAGRIARLEIVRAQQRAAALERPRAPQVALSRADIERLIERLQRHITESRR